MRITRLFLNTDLRGGHNMLGKLAMLNKIDVRKLDGEFVVFINKKKTAVKIFAPGNVIAHYKSDKRIDMRAIQHIPLCFQGHQFDYNQAIKKVVEKEFRVTA